MSIGPSLLCVCLPREVWERPSEDASGDLREFHTCLADARAIEKRLPTSPDREADLRRYAAVCRRLEELAVGLRSRGEEIAIGGDYLSAVGAIGQVRGATPRIAASFFTPDQLRIQCLALSQFPEAEASDALRVFNAAEQVGAGIVLVISEFTASRNLVPKPTAPIRSEAVASPDPDDAGTVEEHRSVSEALRNQVARAIASPGGAPVPFGAYSDPIIVRVLRDFAFGRGARSEVGVVYSDGSRGAPFPVHSLEAASNNAGPGVLLRAVLVSMRHLDLDGMVDVAWFRNRDVSVPRPSGETEARCFETTITRLRELRETPSDTSLTIEMYHTGLPPAVIGFYRAVAAALQEGLWPPGELVVVPVLYEPWNGGYRAAAPWAGQAR